MTHQCSKKHGVQEGESFTDAFLSPFLEITLTGGIGLLLGTLLVAS